MRRATTERRRLLIVAIALSAICINGFAQSGVQRGGPLPPPSPLFPPDNWWNIDISRAPVDPRSDSFLLGIGRNRSLVPNFGGDIKKAKAPDQLIYGIPYIVVPGNQPLEIVSFQDVQRSDDGAPGRPPGYPIPLEARTQPKFTEGGVAANDGAGEGERRMILVDRDNRLLFELADAQFDPREGIWRAMRGAVFPLDQNARRPDGFPSALASGLEILPGLVRYDEVYGVGPIRHAFGVSVRRSNWYVFPATRAAAIIPDTIPMGARLRLKASKNISKYPVPLRRILEAMKTYGLIVSAPGPDLWVNGTYDTRWDRKFIDLAFKSMRASDFEVIELGWDPFGRTNPEFPITP